MKTKAKQLEYSRIDFFYYAFRNVLFVSIPLVIISTIILSLPHSSATNSGSDSVTLTLSTSCTLSSSVITPHHASLNGGQYEEGIGNTRINTYCNDNNGYSIYAIGTSNNVDGNTDLVSDIDEQYNIHTGAYVNGNNIDTSTPSFWGMKLIPGIGTGSSSELTPPTIMNSYNSYNVIPSSYTLVASRTSGTNMTIDTDITGSYFNTTYNIYASSVQPAGSYEGRVKYVMVHPHSTGSNIGFNEAFAFSGKERHGFYYAMQDMDVNICNMVNIYDEPSQTQLVDTRDSKLYWVAKLQDGHCWMTQNLDFDINSNTTLDSTTTDLNVAYNSSTGQYAEYNDGYTESNGVIYYTPASSATTIDFQNNTVEGWSNNSSRNTPASANKTDAMETGYNALGNYYNWTVAIASNNSSVAITSAKNSICPKGWRLPTIPSLSNNDFVNLNLLYEDASLAPLFFKKAGHVSASSQISDIGSIGLYISSNSYYNSGFYGASIINNTLITNTWWMNDYDGRRGGDSIRCIAR